RTKAGQAEVRVRDHQGNLTDERRADSGHGISCGLPGEGGEIRWPSCDRLRRLLVMQMAMVGLGRMGANMVRRLMRDGHECVVYDVRPESVAALAEDGDVGT